MLASDDLAACVGFTLLLLTARDDGWPHLTMLSVGEVIIVTERRLRLAIWPASTAASNLVARQRATLAAVVTPTAWLLRVSVRPLQPIETPLGGRRAAFDADVVEAAADEAPYAVLDSGVHFRLNDETETLPRWAEVRRALAGASA
jgi:hypothetical protein